MAGKANLLGHPIHPMLIVFPLGLLPAAVVCDVIFLVRHNPNWGHVAYWLIAGGVLGGLAAALFGFIDWLGLESGTRAKRIGAWHGGINVIVTALFAVSWFLRRAAPDSPTMPAIAFGMIALVFALVAAWMGGELVYRLSVGVDQGAHVDSPSSLSDRPASADAKTM
ncbi:MAG: DUF2231 domain-containing protein [Verrucomicrobiota bacterium]|nr:DUF2231 domain-containing protein [Verrucomicrobiota bacterium]